MGYEIDGYYSEEAEQWTIRNNVQNSDLIDLAKRLNRYCHIVATKLEINSTDGQQVICAALFVRSLEFFQGALLLIERGLSNPAKVTLRSFLETTFTIRAVASDMEVMRRYVEADKYERLRSLRIIRSNPSAFKSALMDDEREELEALIAELESDGDVKRSLKIPIHEMAKLAELTDTYASAYTYLSNTVHSAVRDMENYLVLDEDNNIQQMRWGPDGSDTDKLLITATEAMSHSLSAIELLFGLEQDGHQELLSILNDLGKKIIGK